MNIAEIESELRDLADRPFDPATFVFRLLEIYDAPKATVTKLKQSTVLGVGIPGEVLWQRKLFFRGTGAGQAARTVDAMMTDPRVKKNKPRFVFATDGHEVYCRDLKTDEVLDVSFQKLSEAFLFFLPLANIERYEAPGESPADIKATGRVAKLYDAILEANGDWIERDYTHDLNQFMTRLLFCFFAEDTSIFEKDSFTSTVINLTQEDGSNTSAVFDLLFEAMNTPLRARKNLPDFARRFPYVNGGLFRSKIQIPKFSKRARRLLKECGELYWREINPDILGSMIQAVAQPGLREDMGLHYTSVPNIMKVLHPLFLLSLEEEFVAAKHNEIRLRKLLQRIYGLRVFDPACGSGNFLIIAYKELRRLEMRIFEHQKEIAQQWALPMTGVKLDHFFGIELTDFAAETAKLSLWIAEYQMNELFKATFGESPPDLPLRDGGKISRANATRLAWKTVCAPSAESETYVVGNPPYSGSVYQSEDQKADIEEVFSGELKSFRDLDYVACWYLKAAEYIQETGAQSGLVATNSICQGEQVAMLWPLIYKRGVEIGFAHQSFKWRNNAAHNAGVTCVVVGLRQKQKSKKIIYDGATSRIVKNIGPYLIEMDDTVVVKRSSSLSSLPTMVKGNQPSDDGHLLLSASEVAELRNECPEATRFVRRFYGSQEFVKGIERWCIWIERDEMETALSMPPLAERINAVRVFRENGKSQQSRDNAGSPHRFAYAPHIDGQAIIVPRVASERRRYIPVGLMPDGAIVSDNAYAIYRAPEFLISVLSSRLHAIWALTVGGRMKTDYRYSNTLVYNTFPLPVLSDRQKDTLEDSAIQILSIRESFAGKTIARLYDPESMPKQLLDAHAELDETLENIYVGRTFKNDTERLEHLFKLYAVMTKKAETSRQQQGRPTNG